MYVSKRESRHHWKLSMFHLHWKTLNWLFNFVSFTLPIMMLNIFLYIFDNLNSWICELSVYLSIIYWFYFWLWILGWSIQKSFAKYFFQEIINWMKLMLHIFHNKRKFPNKRSTLFIEIPLFIKATLTLLSV